jgi:hypothetical protein
MKRPRTTKAAKTEGLTVGSPDISVPTLGQVHNLVAIGIGGKKQRKKRATEQERTRKGIQKLEKRVGSLDGKKPGEILYLFGKYKIFSERRMPKRDTVARVRGNRK